MDGLVAGPVASLAALRHPTLSLALPAAAAVPLGFRRPDCLVLALVPLSVVSTAYGRGNLVILWGVAILVAAALTRRRESLNVWKHTWSLLCVASLILFLFGSLMIGGSDAASSGLPSDFPGFIAGLALLAVASRVSIAPAAVARIVVLSGSAAAVYVLARGSYPDGRLAGLGLYNNYLGALIAVPTAVGIGLARRGNTIGWLICSGACLGAVVQTHSRGAIVAAATGVAVALITDRPPRHQVIGIAAALALGAVLVKVANPLQDVAYGARTAAELSANSTVRAEAAEMAFSVAMQHPLLGIGYGMFPHAALDDPRLGIYMNTHNDYLRLAAEAGTVTLFLFLAVLIAGLTAPPGPELTPLRAGVATGAVTLMFANTLSNMTVSIIFWVCLGCLLGSRYQRSRKIILEGHDQ